MIIYQLLDGNRAESGLMVSLALWDVSLQERRECVYLGRPGAAWSASAVVTEGGKRVRSCRTGRVLMRGRRGGRESGVELERRTHSRYRRGHLQPRKRDKVANESLG